MKLSQTIKYIIGTMPVLLFVSFVISFFLIHKDTINEEISLSIYFFGGTIIVYMLYVFFNDIPYLKLNYNIIKYTFMATLGIFFDTFILLISIILILSNHIFIAIILLGVNLIIRSISLLWSAHDLNFLKTSPSFILYRSLISEIIHQHEDDIRIIECKAKINQIIIESNI